jgi:hypothetical protein
VSKSPSHTLSTTRISSPPPPPQTNSSISAADQNIATGFATPCPVISDALPCTGSNMEGFFLVGSRLLDGATPILPAKAAAKSLKISMSKFAPQYSRNGCSEMTPTRGRNKPPLISPPLNQFIRRGIPERELHQNMPLLLKDFLLSDLRFSLYYYAVY